MTSAVVRKFKLDYKAQVFSTYRNSENCWDFPEPKLPFLANDLKSMQDGFRRLSEYNVFGCSIRNSDELIGGVREVSIQFFFFSGMTLKDPLNHEPKSIGGFGGRSQPPPALRRWCAELEREGTGNYVMPSTVGFDLKVLIESNPLEFSALYLALFSSPAIRIVGLEMHAYMNHLAWEFGARCPCFSLRPISNMQILNRVTVLQTTPTLRELAARCAGVKLPKNRIIGNWSQRPFTQDQWQKAAYEAPASLLVYFCAGADSFNYVTNI